MNMSTKIALIIAAGVACFLSACMVFGHAMATLDSNSTGALALFWTAAAFLSGVVAAGSPYGILFAVCMVDPYRGRTTNRVPLGIAIPLMLAVPVVATLTLLGSIGRLADRIDQDVTMSVGGGFWFGMLIVSIVTLMLFPPFVREVYSSANIKGGRVQFPCR